MKGSKKETTRRAGAESCQPLNAKEKEESHPPSQSRRKADGAGEPERPSQKEKQKERRDERKKKDLQYKYSKESCPAGVRSLPPRHPCIVNTSYPHKQSKGRRS